MRFVALRLIVLLVVCSVRGSSPELYVCLDRSLQSSPQPLFYAYVDGKKTSCMPRNELLLLLNSSPHKDDPEKVEQQRMVARIDSLKSVATPRTDYSSKDLSSTDFKGAKLAGVSFRGANLSSADLRGADLRGADLSNANLSAAYLKGADLRGADFSGANLNGTYLNEADLRGIKGFSLESVRLCRTLQHATLDTLFKEEIEYCCSDKLKTSSWYWHDNQWADERGKRRRKSEVTQVRISIPEDK